MTLQGNFPTVIIITPGSVHDVNILDQLVWESGGTGFRGGVRKLPALSAVPVTSKR
jgi:hypothetical protein